MSVMLLIIANAATANIQYHCHLQLTGRNRNSIDRESFVCFCRLMNVNIRLVAKRDANTSPILERDFRGSMAE
jgi:hypothetical protein